MERRRSNMPELMDDPSVQYGELELALEELGVINRWLGGHRTTRLGVDRLTRDLPAAEALTVLDLGAGGADLCAVLRPLDRRFDVTGLDINPNMREFAQRHRHTSGAVTASAHALPYSDRSFDIVHASLFLHHCTDDEAKGVLEQAVRIARVGVVVNELQRHRFARFAIALLTALLARSPIVRHDAPLSVQRGFTRRELAAIVPRAWISRTSLSWHWAFRWCLCIAGVQGGSDG